MSDMMSVHPDEKTAIDLASSHTSGDEHDGILEGKIFIRLREAYWRGWSDHKKGCAQLSEIYDAAIFRWRSQAVASLSPEQLQQALCRMIHRTGSDIGYDWTDEEIKNFASFKDTDNGKIPL